MNIYIFKYQGIIVIPIFIYRSTSTMFSLNQTVPTALNVFGERPTCVTNVPRIAATMSVPYSPEYSSLSSGDVNSL